MFRYAKIFLLHFEHVFEYRSRTFIWFLISFLNPLLFLLFWRGAIGDKNIAGWTLPLITSYYFITIIANACLMSHTEEDVATVDIREGELSKYLIKPFSYFWTKFYQEIPYRVIQGSYGIITIIIFLIIFGPFIKFADNFKIISLSIIIAIMAYFLSFAFKMIIGITAFWIADIWGLFQLIEIVILTFSGQVMPITLLPDYLKNISNILPFAYIIYYPVIAFQGNLSVVALLNIILMQAIWLFVFILIYKTLWGRGIKKFTAVGQ